MLNHMVALTTYDAVQNHRGIPTKILISHPQLILGYKT